MSDYRLEDRDIIGRSHFDIFPEIPDRWKAAHRRGLEGEVVQADEDNFVRMDGTVQWLRWEVRPWYTTDGSIGGIVIFTEDITERKQTEEALREHREHLEELVAERTAQLNDRVAEVERLNRALTNLLEDLQVTNRYLEDTTDKLKEANKELESFAYAVSHDLKAPLRAINGFAQIISRRHRADLNEEAQHYFDNIVEAGAQMDALIDDLLRYSRLGRTAVRIRPVPLGDIFHQLARDLAGRVADTGAQLNLPVADDLPVVMGDPTLLIQIFSNLLNNALIYYRPGTQPQVKVSWQVEHDRVTVSVADNGVGIAPEYHDKVFDVFQRLHSHAEYPGTGIGLAIVKKVTDILGGEVGVESAVGEGSSFSVTLLRKEIEEVV
jgi:light-regulated signal transduction histidine kinase (bacteriophytochrome)